MPRLQNLSDLIERVRPNRLVPGLSRELWLIVVRQLPGVFPQPLAQCLRSARAPLLNHTACTAHACTKACALQRGT